ncbi:hypothetical protein WMY93_015058 [Mugilogobius chulae]|uniref:Uncharacterized protein n=1 Tax=Mugilogobius chulae TaxID=88201 RepID=A0AAW0NX44_9GOBI
MASISTANLLSDDVDIYTSNQDLTNTDLYQSDSVSSRISNKSRTNMMPSTDSATLVREEATELSSLKRSTIVIRRKSTTRRASAPEMQNLSRAPVASPRKKSSNLEPTGTDNCSFHPDTPASSATQPDRHMESVIAYRRRRRLLSDTSLLQQRRTQRDPPQQEPIETANAGVCLEPLFTGEEQCVEDWPVGSPELDPNFRPSGSFRLRRESIKLKTESSSTPKKKSIIRRTLRKSKNKAQTTEEQSTEAPEAASGVSTPVNNAPTQPQNVEPAGAVAPDLSLPTVINAPVPNSDPGQPRRLVAHTATAAAPADLPPPVVHTSVAAEPHRPAPALTAAAAAPVILLPNQNLNLEEGVPEETMAAMAGWLAARMDEINREREAEQEEEEEDGDTDSLLEWWDTVEQWEQVPSTGNRQEEHRIFLSVISKERRALSVYFRVFTECAEVLWQSVVILHQLADDIRKYHRGAVIASIGGGVAMGVGGVAILVGLILAPITLGFSLIATVAGLGLATAGGVTTGTAIVSDKVKDAKKRKKAAGVLVDNEKYLLEMQKILLFISTGLQILQGHPFLLLRRGYRGADLEIQRARQMLQLLSTPVGKALSVCNKAVNVVQGMFSGVNRYFDQGRKLKKSYITVIVSEIKGSADVLHDCVLEMSKIKNQMEVATERCGLMEIVDV